MPFTLPAPASQADTLSRLAATATLHRRAETHLPTRAPGSPSAVRLLLYWHLLSLDAPTVAAVWTLFLLPPATRTSPQAAALATAMFLAVWVLYAADRLLDTRLLDARFLDARLLDARLPNHYAAPGLEARHYFHARHRTRFRAALALASCALPPLVLHLPSALLRGYILLAAAVCAWLALVHFSPGALRRLLPKELAAAFFFAAAVTLPAHAGPRILAAVAFIAALNTFLITAWEAADPRPYVSMLPAAAAAMAVFMLSLLVPAPTGLACALASVLLLALHLARHRLSPTALRAAADLALLTPIPFLIAHLTRPSR